MAVSPWTPSRTPKTRVVRPWVNQLTNLVACPFHVSYWLTSSPIWILSPCVYRAELQMGMRLAWPLALAFFIHTDSCCGPCEMGLRLRYRLFGSQFCLSLNSDCSIFCSLANPGLNSHYTACGQNQGEGRSVWRLSLSFDLIGPIRSARIGPAALADGNVYVYVCSYVNRIIISTTRLGHARAGPWQVHYGHDHGHTST